MGSFLRVLLLALSLFVLECSGASKQECARHSQNVRIHFLIKVGEGFSEFQKMLIAAGMAEWKRALNPVISFDLEFVPLIKDDIYFMSEKERYQSFADDEIYIMIVPAKESEDKPNRLAYFSSEYIVSFIGIINERLEDQDMVMYRSVIIHELGHAFGLDHSTSLGESVMTEFVNDSANCITEEDIERVCEMWCCDTSVMNPCDPSDEVAQPIVLRLSSQF